MSSSEQDRVGRRRLVQGALVGLAATGGLPLAPPSAAAPVDPGAGGLVTPNPVRSIARSGIAVELVDFCAPPRTSPTTKPFAFLNFVYHAGDGSRRLFACDSRGKLWQINGQTGVVQRTPFLDLADLRRAALIAERWTMGFRGFAFHPDFDRNGQPGFRKLYTVSTETAASRPSGVTLFTDPAYRTHHHDVVAEWSVDATNSGVIPSSRRELLRIAMYKVEHNTDTLMFDPNLAPGAPGYGMMFITVGDGGNVPSNPDPFNQAQNRGRALGKILRINPLRQGTAAYGIPPDNPFRGQAGVLPEIYAWGFRHPQNLSFDTGGTTRRLINTDVGQRNIEEVNIVEPGRNYGWPEREGTFVADRTDSSRLWARGPNDARQGFTYPVAQYDHDEGQNRTGKAAIVGGYVYRGSAVPSLVGHYLCGDIVNGRVFHVAVNSLQQGRQTVLQELTFFRNGAQTTLKSLVNGVEGRVDLRFGQDESGEVYIVTKQDGWIRRMRPRAPVA